MAAAVIAISALAACGGGATSSPTTPVTASNPTTPVTTSNPTTPVTTSNLTTPITTSSPTTEVIHGFTVPVAPDATANNATLAGVVTNSYAVRDDVMRKIAIDVSNSADYQATLEVAAAYQKMLTTPQPQNRTDALKLFSAFGCAGKSGSAYHAGDASYYLVQTFNTPSRQAAYGAVIKQIGGGMLGSEIPSCN